jgi:superfamily II DNA or RNA helicase
MNSTVIIPQAVLDIRLRLTHAPKAVAHALIERSTFTNPAFLEAQKQGRSTFGIPTTREYWSWEDDTLIVPRGLWSAAQEALGSNVVVTDRRILTPPIPFGWKGPNLFAYQKGALDHALPHDHGLLIGPCGCGKTNWLAAVIAKRRQRALIVVPTKELLYQTRERFLELWDVSSEALGLIGDGHWEIGTHATVALPHTLRLHDLADLRDQFGLVACDESHLAAAPLFESVLQQFPAFYRIGVTATPHRRDGMEGLVAAVLGPIVARITVDDLVAADRLVRPEVHQVQSAFAYPYTKDYSKLLAALTADPARNQLIRDLAIREAQDGHQVLVLSERVAHVQCLGALIQDQDPELTVAVVTGSTSAKRREAAIEGAREGRVQVLLATRLADLGLDIPTLDRLILASGGRHEGRVTQQIGRIMRAQTGKHAIVYDIIDPNAPVLAAQARARFYRAYRPLGVRVIREEASA